MQRAQCGDNTINMQTALSAIQIEASHFLIRLTAQAQAGFHKKSSTIFSKMQQSSIW